MDNTRQSTEPFLDVVVEAVNASQEAKAKNPVALGLKELTDICEYFVVLSARSDRHAQGIANRVIEELSKRGLKPFSVEGFETGHWILLDFDEIIVHIFYEPIRARYDLEGLWAKAKRINFKENEEAHSVAA